jgi:hypothetical protein
MSKPLGFLSSDGAQGNAILEQIRNLDTVRQDNTRTSADDETDLDAAANRKQLARDIAAIERATALLRRVEPALQSWSEPPPTAATIGQGARPVWLLIGVLWVSTALVTLGAVYAISALVG